MISVSARRGGSKPEGAGKGGDKIFIPSHVAPRPRVRRGPEAEKAVDSPLSTPIMMMVWTAIGFLAVPGAAVIVGPLPPTSESQTS